MRFPPCYPAALSLLLVSLCFGGTAGAGSVSFLPASDKDAGDAYPFTSGLTNPEGVAIMTVGVDDPGDPNAEFRSALEFDISSLTAGTTIDAASLTFFVNGPDAFPGVEVHGYAGNGVVETADMLPVNLLHTFAAPGGSTNVDITLDVTSFIQFLVSGSSNHAGFSLRAAGGAVLVWSREASDVSLRPTLAVTFTPASVPDAPSLSLLSAGLIGLLFNRRWSRTRRPG